MRKTAQAFPCQDDNAILKENEVTEQPKFNVPGESCKTKLFMGVFFDGTRNNYTESDTHAFATRA